MTDADFAGAQPTLLAYAFACCRDRHLAEDLVQDALALAWERRAERSPGVTIVGFCIGFVRLRWFREREGRGLRERLPLAVHERAEALFAPVPEEEDLREREALAACLALVRPADRDLLVRHHVGEQALGSIALECGRGLSWVKVRLHRLRTALAACIRRRLRGDGAAHG